MNIEVKTDIIIVKRMKTIIEVKDLKIKIENILKIMKEKGIKMMTEEETQKVQEDTIEK
jgi:hypothetical protein